MKLARNLSLVACSIFILLTVTVMVKAQTRAEMVKDNVKKTSDYVLPFPGILPDNVLYNLKVVRDKVFEFLIIDPVKKADFYLLQADKRLASGEALINNSKFLLGEQTISKAEKYLIQAVDMASVAKARGKEVNDIMERLKKAGQKHAEVISALQKSSPESISEGLLLSLSLNEKAIAGLNNLLGPKEATSSSSLAPK
ncbi:hypothetical protein HY030_03180 [Candidatus Gottesmanbacteria bacterium]|nr:hypothetical protein [Candidatus Gottesmanbacteria bacterium]